MDKITVPKENCDYVEFNRNNTQLPRNKEDINTRSENKFFNHIYHHLIAIGRNKIQNNYYRQNIQVESLIHDAYFRIIELDRVQWRDENHYFSVWAGTMRRVIIDQSRANNTFKRGKLFENTEFYDSPLIDCYFEQLELYDALEKLYIINTDYFEIVMFRFFVGLTTKEVAVELAISPATVKRKWNCAQNRLQNQLQ